MDDLGPENDGRTTVASRSAVTDVPVGVPIAVPFAKDHPLSSAASTGTNGTKPGTATAGPPATEESFTDESLDESLDDSSDDLESLLPHQSSHNVGDGNGRGGPSEGAAPGGVHVVSAPLEVHMPEHDPHRDGIGAGPWWLCGICPRSVGNMTILFPDHLRSSGWGVVGPHLFGPVCVWFLLAGASHLCVRSAYRHGLGMGSVVICYLFMALSTYRLTDVSLRDPGICLDREVPGHVDPDRARQYRFCDRCRCWQPPDGMHCPECDVCVAGYDHHCVWMGTCIGKRNYRQFVLFNVSWLYYVAYALFWLLTFGPMVMKK